MAGKAKKDQARANTAALNSLHTTSIGINIVFIILSILYLKRSVVAYALLSIPALGCQYALEISGRPKYDAKGVLARAGEDLSAQGLTEYMFDVIWVTWATLLAVTVFGRLGWFVYLVVPIYGAYIAWGLFGKARGMMGGNQTPQPLDQQQQPMNRKQRRAAA